MKVLNGFDICQSVKVLEMASFTFTCAPAIMTEIQTIANYAIQELVKPLNFLPVFMFRPVKQTV